MSSPATAYVLKLSSERMSALRHELFIADRFAEPVPEFVHSRSVRLVCIVCDVEGRVQYIGDGHRGVRAGTGMRRLNISALTKMSAPFLLDKALELLPKVYREPVARRLLSGGVLTANQFSALADALLQGGGQLAELVARYSALRAERIAALSPKERNQLAYQKEALGAALSFAGMERKVLQEWEPPVLGEAESFLSGLPQVRAREDAIIANDLAVVPGFNFVKEVVSGAALFENKAGTRLTVVLANRLPLEQLTGADLIYYNESFKSFVLVQYKAMQRTAGENVVFRLPDSQLDAEISRMQSLISALQAGARAIDAKDFRLAWNPFFIKLCPRELFQPDDSSLWRGMYIPIDKWALLVGSADIVGQKGGRGITFDNVGRYMDNTTFINLVANAWIGTHKDQSALLESAIRDTVASGRAVVLAVKREKGGLALVGDSSYTEPAVLND